MVKVKLIKPATTIIYDGVAYSRGDVCVMDDDSAKNYLRNGYVSLCDDSTDEEE